MRRSDLEHIIRAAGSITGDDEIVVVGSQAILGQFPDAPDALLRSLEADVYPKNMAHLSDLVDGSIGELSPFHMTFGYYAHGVAQETTILPKGWEKRLIPIKNDNTRGVTGWCLEAHDLVIAKYVAGRERDLEFASTAVKYGLVRKNLLLERISLLPVEPSVGERVKGRVLADFNRKKRA